MPNPNSYTGRFLCAGFTLIELLVVITIIVVLLALLTPALDKAIYQAELAVCMSNQHGISAGALSYATSWNRKYPYRPTLQSSFNDGLGASMEPYRVTDSGGAGNPQTDLRFVAEGYIGDRMYVDPLHEPVDYSWGANGVRTHIWVAYALWFSFQYTEQGNRQPGMWKLGDRWGYTTFDENGTPTKYRWNYLSGDMGVNVGDTAIWNAHPDHEGVMTSFHVQHEQFGQNPRVSYTQAHWRSANSVQRGPVDMQVSSSDGSVERFTDLKWNDDRLVLTPHWHDTPEGAGRGVLAGSVYMQVPK